MIDDIKTVLWKEVKEEIIANKQVLLGLLLMLPVFGVVLPYQIGSSIVDKPYMLIFMSLIPLVMVLNVLTDSFAGERERHTLETLLATRLSDHAILYGKILTAVIYAWGVTLLDIAAALITINVAFWQGEILMFSPLACLLIALITLALSVLVTSAGVLMSLRAPTVRQAEINFLIGLAAIAFALMAVGFLVPDDTMDRVQNWVASVGLDNVMALVLLALIALNVAVIMVALNRFQRNKLILD